MSSDGFYTIDGNDYWFKPDGSMVNDCGISMTLLQMIAGLDNGITSIKMEPFTQMAGCGTTDTGIIILMVR